MSRELRIALTTGFVVLGAGLLVLGIYGGDLVDVLRKAISICLECIGIG